MDRRDDSTQLTLNHTTRRRIITTAGAAGIGLASLGLLKGTPSIYAAGMSGSQADSLSKAMRKLWEEHVAWTRLYIVSFAAGLPDLNVTAQRLLRNQVDIGRAIKPFYGTAAGDQLTTLLKQHILGAVTLLTAAKAGDKAKVGQATTAWYANGDQIAAFLNGANPQNWLLPDMRSMMRRHLDLTLQEAVARLHGNYAADIAAYDRVEQEILRMADMLTAGIIAQFPNRFPT